MLEREFSHRAPSSGGRHLGAFVFMCCRRRDIRLLTCTNCLSLGLRLFGSFSQPRIPRIPRIHMYCTCYYDKDTHHAIRSLQYFVCFVMQVLISACLWHQLSWSWRLGLYKNQPLNPDCFISSPTHVARPFNLEILGTRSFEQRKMPH